MAHKSAKAVGSPEPIMDEVFSTQHLKSPLLERAGFRHAFFTRLGGVSDGAYSSLNFSIAVGDEPENVNENLRRAAHSLGVSVDRTYFLSQVHGREVQYT